MNAGPAAKSRLARGLAILSAPKVIAMLNLVLALVVTFGIIIISFFNAPIADDFAYYHNLQANGFFQQMENYYQQEPGRVLQAVIVYLGYHFFGLDAVRLLPGITFLALSASIGLLLYRIKLFKRGTECLTASTLLSAAFIFVLPSLFDSLLWYTASYVVSIVCGIVSITLLIILLQSPKIPFWVKLVFYLIMLIGQTYNELTALVLIAVFGLLFLGALLKKQWQTWKIFLPSMASLVAGFLVIYRSPGSSSRRTTVPELDLDTIFIGSFGNFGIITSNLTLVAVLVLIATGYLFGARAHFAYVGTVIKTLRINAVQARLLIVGLFVSMTYLVFCINNYTQPWHVPYRVVTVPAFAVTVLIVGLLTWAVYALKKSGRTNAWLALQITMPVLVVVSTVGVIINMQSIAHNLALRQDAVEQRDDSVRQQLRRGETTSKTLYISAAPVNLRSNSFDCFYDAAMNYKDNINWVCVTYLLSQNTDATSFEKVIIQPSITDYDNDVIIERNQGAKDYLSD